MAHLKELILSMLVIFHLALARPGAFEEFRTAFHENRCNQSNSDQRIIEVCQRCAKQTKSPIVYPMCCENQEDAYNWCDKYINYGKQSK